MIRRFRHSGLERFFRTGDAGGINPQHAVRLRRLLTSLNASAGPSGMALPGYRLHPLKATAKANGRFRYRGIGG